MRDRLIELLFETGMVESRRRCNIMAEELLANGVIVPPCKVGSYVYCRVEGFSQLMKGRVRQITTFKEGCFVFEVEIHGYFAQKYTNEDVGKIVFITREEAEQALKGGAE